MRHLNLCRGTVLANRLSGRISFFLLGVALLAAIPLSAAGQTVAMTDVESAVLKEDWTQVVELLKNVSSDPKQSPDPVLRWVKAHACLATNANNEFLGLLLSLRENDDLCRCRAWADNLVNGHPGSAIARYFQGDALARLDERDQAEKSFCAALEIQPGHALTLHARAVIRAAGDKLDEAGEDFREAVQANPGIAEIHVSRATYLVQKRTSAKKALELYETALNISPGYVLAINGRGSMYIVLHKLPEAAEDLKKARELAIAGLSDIAQVVDMNRAALANAVNGALNKKLQEVAGLQPGTTIDEVLKAGALLPPQKRQELLNAMQNAANNSRAWAPNLPQDSTAKVEASVTKPAIGPPSGTLQGHVEAVWHPSQGSQHDADDWQAKVDAFGTKYNMRPQMDNGNPIANLRSAIELHSVPGAQPGGVSSASLGNHTDCGDWGVPTCYGLQYRMGSTKKGLPAEERR